MNIKEIIKEFKRNENFLVLPPCGIPRVKKGHILPEDLKEFYELCGGIECYINDSGFPIKVVSPDKIEQANIVLLGEEYSEDISASWYIVCDAEDGNYITIDCDSKRLGKCYESFEYKHAIRGNCKVVAYTFTELLHNILEYKGDYFYWNDNPDFISHGDAYDNTYLKGV